MVMITVKFMSIDRQRARAGAVKFTSQKSDAVSVVQLCFFRYPYPVNQGLKYLFDLGRIRVNRYHSGE